MKFSLQDIIDAPSFERAIADAREEFPVWKTYRDKLKEKILFSCTPQQTPVIVHTLGCPASGKTTLLNYCREQGQLPQQSFSLGFDNIMEEFPAYQADIANHGLQAAYERWEIPARALGYELLGFALENKFNIIFEHSGAREDHIKLLKTLKRDPGYRVVLLDTQCAVEIALARVQNRTRYLPPAYIRQRREVINRLRPEYYLLADEIRVYNTENYPPVLLETA